MAVQRITWVFRCPEKPPGYRTVWHDMKPGVTSFLVVKSRSPQLSILDCPPRSAPAPFSCEDFRSWGTETYTLRVKQIWNLRLPQASGPDLYFQTLLKMLSGSAVFLHCGNFCRIKKCFKYGIWVFFLCSLERSSASSSGPTLKGLAVPFPSLQSYLLKSFF